MVLINTKFMDNFNLIDKQALDDVCHFLQPFEEHLVKTNDLVYITETMFN